MKYKTYTFRAYPNKTQANLFYLTFLMCRIMFNTLLAIVLDNFSKYNSEVEYCLANNFNPMSKAEFSKQVCRKFGLTTKPKKIGGKLFRIYVKND